MADTRDVSGAVVRMPPQPALAADLATSATWKRSHLVARVRELRDHAWQRIAAHQTERINEITGIDVAASLAAVVDEVIAALVRFALGRAEAPADWQDHLGVFALGGYGRGEFNPASDLDLMLVSRSSPSAWIRTANSELQTLLWDVKFQVGASLRPLGELRQILANDFVTATALLEQRPLLAGAPVIDGLERVLAEFRRRRRKPFLRYKVEELEERRSKAGESLFEMEPHLKTGPGGLRDNQFLRSVAWAVFGARTLHGLRDLGSIDWEDVQACLAANDHHLGLRSLLHFHHRRRHDVLTLADQQRCATQLGWGGSTPRRRAEHLMRRHYRSVLDVARVVDLVRSRLQALGHLGRRLILVKTRRRLDRSFAIIDGRAFLADRQLWRSPDALVEVFAAARSAQLRGVRLSIELQRSIADHLHRVDDALRRDPRVAATMRAILGAAGRVAPILTDLHRSQLLGAWLPEFGQITCHMQFDAYHRYTVDEHTLIALDQLDQVARGEGPHGHLAPLVQAAADADLLALALLLHDVGKVANGGHVERGALMVPGVADRLGLTADETDLVHFLVAHHLSLSDATRTRDIDDPDLLEQLAATIGDQRRLDLLFLLTLVDGEAVGPGALTGWQLSLLTQLHTSLTAILAGRPASGRRREALLMALVADGGSQQEAEAHLAGLPAAYAFQARSREVVGHRRLLAEAAAGTGFAWQHEVGDSGHVLVVVFADRSELLADVATICTGHGLDIHGCRIWINDRKQALVSLRLVGLSRDKWRSESSWQRLADELYRYASGGVPVQEYLERRHGMVGYERPPDSGHDEIAVVVENTMDRATILDVRVKDRIGLLALIARSISAAGCQIGFASISTMGDVAVDVFYLTQDGQRLDNERAAAVAALVEARLAEPAAA